MPQEKKKLLLNRLAQLARLALFHLGTRRALAKVPLTTGQRPAATVAPPTCCQVSGIVTDVRLSQSPFKLSLASPWPLRQMGALNPKGFLETLHLSQYATALVQIYGSP